MGTLLRSLQTVSTYSAARSIWLAPSTKSDPKEDLYRLQLHAENPRAQGQSVRASSREGAGKLPPATSSGLSSTFPGVRGGPGPGRGGRRGGPSLLTSRGPLLLTFSRRLSSAAYLARGRAEGLRAGERSRWGLSGPRPSSRPTSGMTRAVDAPTWVSGQGGPHGFRVPEPSSESSAGPPPPPAAAALDPSQRIPEVAGPRGRDRARAAPSPPPQSGRGRARSGDVKGRAVAAPPRALVKKKKKRGNETWEAVWEAAAAGRGDLSII